MHCNWGAGGTRRDVVDLPDRRVRLEILERRTAFLGTLEGFVTRAAELREMSTVRMRIMKGGKARREWRPIMVAIRRMS